MRNLIVTLLTVASLSIPAFAVERIPLKPEMRVPVTREEIQVIRFPYNVMSVLIDTSKGIQVKAQGKNLIIKWNPYYKNPAVVSVTLIDDKGNTHDCALICIPKRKIPEVVEVYIPSKVLEMQRRKKAEELEKGMPYEEFIVTLIKEFMTGQYPGYYDVKKENKVLGIFKEIEVCATEEAQGDKFAVIKGLVKNRLNVPIHIDETVLSFLSKTYDVKAISIRKHDLNPGEATTFVVVVGRAD